MAKKYHERNGWQRNGSGVKIISGNIENISVEISMKASA
jgi:hypothetical protein